MTRQIIVEILGDTRGFDKATTQAMGKAGKFGNVMKGAGLGIGIGAVGLATQAIGQFTDVLGDASKAYQEDQASQKRMTQALKNSVPGWDGTTDSIEDFILSLQHLGVADEVARDAMTNFASITHSVSESQVLLQAALDLSAAKGIDLASASDIVTKAYQGNTKSLKPLGIALEKGATGLEAIDQLQQQVKGSAEELANTEEGKQTAASLKAGEAMERLGMVVSKVASVILPILADAFELVVNVIGEVWPVIEPIAVGIASVLFPILQKLIGFIQTVLVPVFKTAWGNISNAFSVAASVIGPIVTALLAVFNTISTVIGTVATAVGTAIGKIIGFFTGIGAKIAAATSGMWNGIWNAFRNVINFIIDGWNSLKFTLPEMDLGPLGKVGGFTIGTPNIPRLHQGGRVPGVPGTDVLTLLEAGEQVTPRGGGGPQIHIHVGMLVGSDAGAADALANLMVEKLRARGAFG